jgi:hypothetical protein
LEFKEKQFSITRLVPDIMQIGLGQHSIRMCGNSEEVKDALTSWLMPLGKVEIWSDCLAYDWVLFCNLFGGALNIPQEVYYIPYDLSTLFKILHIDSDVNREEYAELVNDPAKQKHNALWDAYVIMKCCNKLLGEGDVEGDESFDSAEPLAVGSVYPSTVPTVFIPDTNDMYGGAHFYTFTDSLGFKDGEAQYADSMQALQFVQKSPDGKMVPGLQSEQLVIALLDRHAKLNTAFPSPQYDKMKLGLEMFLEACRERVEERIQRGVMGDLKK